MGDANTREKSPFAQSDEEVSKISIDRIDEVVQDIGELMTTTSANAVDEISGLTSSPDQMAPGDEEATNSSAYGVTEKHTVDGSNKTSLTTGKPAAASET